MLSRSFEQKSTNINIIRFLAAIAVIWSHSYAFAQNDYDPIVVLTHGSMSMGGIAVGIFFFISGLYVTKSAKKSKDLWDFLFKRIERIFPQLFIVVVLSAFFLGPIVTVCSTKEYFFCGQTYKYLLNAVLIPVHNLPGVFIDNICDSTVNGPLWTLPVEFLAYCSLAVAIQIGRLFNQKIKQSLLYFFAILFTFSAYLICEYKITNEILANAFRPLVMFYIGALFCENADKIDFKPVIFFLCLIILIISNYFHFFGLAFIFFMPYVIVFLGLGIKQIPLNGIIFLLSYEMYLLGAPIQQTLVNFAGGSMNQWTNFILALIIDIILAYGLNRLSEFFFQKRKRKTVH